MINKEDNLSIGKVQNVEYRDNKKRLNIHDLKRRASQTNRVKEKGIVNPKTGGSLVFHDNGTATIATSLYSQYSIDRSGHAHEVSLESKTTTNRKIIETDEIIINNHKLNPALYELSDVRELLEDQDKVGINLNFNGTILVKTWDEMLEKYVIIRRPYRGPFFYPKINSHIIHEEITRETD